MSKSKIGEKETIPIKFLAFEMESKTTRELKEYATINKGLPVSFSTFIAFSILLTISLGEKTPEQCIPG